MSRQPTKKQTPILEDDEKFVFASEDNIGILLGFDKDMPETQVKIDTEQFALDSSQNVKICCNVNGHTHENKTAKEIEEEQVIQHAAEQLQNIRDQTIIYVRQNSHYQTVVFFRV